MIVGVLIAVLATTIYRQVLHPWLAHDDWEYFLPAGIPHGADTFRHNLSEGRWLNYLWWRSFGQHGHLVVASALFQLAYLVFVVSFARRLLNGWLTALAIPALFVSPMVILMASWPATLAPSMLALGIMVLALPSRGRIRWLVLWLTLVTVLGVLTYPPVAAVAFLVLVIDQRHRPARTFAWLGVWFAVSYAGAVLLSFTLNWLAYGRFGLEISAWRQPQPLHDLASLAANLSRYGTQWQTIWGIVWLPLLIGLVAIVACLVARSTRRQMGIFFLAALLVAVMEASTTVLTGVTTPFRGSMWLWLVIVVPAVWCAKGGARELHGQIRLLGVLGLLAISVWGCLNWSHNVSVHQAIQHQYDVIGERIAVLQVGHSPRTVVLAEMPEQRKGSRFFVQTRSLEMSLYVRDGIRVSRCDRALCDRILHDALPAHPGQSAFVFDQRIVVVPPAPTG